MRGLRTNKVFFSAERSDRDSTFNDSMHDVQGRPHPRPVGTFRAVGQAKALSRDSYTFDQESGRYFVVD